MNEGEGRLTSKFLVFTNPSKPKVCNRVSSEPQLVFVSDIPEHEVAIEAAFQQVAHQCGHDFCYHTEIIIDLSSAQSIYPFLEYVECRKAESLLLSFDVNLSLNDWQLDLNPLSYAEQLREKMFSVYSMPSSQHNLFEEELINIKFLAEVSLDISIEDIVSLYSDRFLIGHENLIYSHNVNKIVKKDIFIPKAYVQPANLIFGFLLTIMRRRFVDKELSLSSVNSRDQSIIRISYPAVVAGAIEHLMLEYAELIRGKVSSQCFFASSRVESAFHLRLLLAKTELGLIASDFHYMDKDDSHLDKETQKMHEALSFAIRRSVLGERPESFSKNSSDLTA